MDKSAAATAEGARQRLAPLFQALESGLYERRQALRLCLLAAVAGESVFLLGPPGVAKSLVARRLQTAFADARCFDYLMGRFSTPEEIFGPVSIRRLKDEDLYVRQTERYLPEADIVFLDEIWKASPPIQNALLTALNEKIFRNGRDELRLPLKLLVGASNESPPDESSQAFWDRFLVRLELGPLRDEAHFLAMLTDGSDPYRDPVAPGLKLGRAEWDQWRAALGAVELSPAALGAVAALRRAFAEAAAAGAGPAVSDRRWKKCAGLLRAAALCDGRLRVEAMDCLLLEHCLWDLPGQRPAAAALVRATVRDLAWADRAGVDELAARLAGLQAQLAAAAGYDEESVVESPVAYDGEYYAFETMPAAAPPLDGGGWQARIWKLDYDTLPAGGAAADTDVFLYQDGAFRRSLSLPCAAAGGWRVAVAGQELALLCERRNAVRRVKRDLDAAEWAAWDGGLAALLADCAAEAAALAGLVAAAKAAVAGHFFLEAADAELLTHGLEARLAALAELQAAAQGCADRHGSC